MILVEYRKVRYIRKNTFTHIEAFALSQSSSFPSHYIPHFHPSDCILLLPPSPNARPRLAADPYSIDNRHQPPHPTHA